MRYYPPQNDYQPLRYFGRVPVYVSTIITALFVAGMLATTMIETANGPIGAFFFSAQQFYGHGWVWQLLTCTFVNSPDFFFIIAAFFFYRICVDVEQYLGRKRFLILYGLMLLTPALVAGAWYLIGWDMFYMGMDDVLIGMFIAYATLYPNLEFLGWVPIKYIAFACMAIASLSYFPSHNWPGLSLMLAFCGVGFGYVRYLQYGAVGPGEVWRKINPFRRQGKFRVLPSPAGQMRVIRPPAVTASVDAILDKIAQKGFASLTSDERDQLEKARDNLQKRDAARKE